MMNKKKLPHIITVTSFVFFIVLGLACASSPTVPVELGANYRKMIQSPVGNERPIDSVTVNGTPTKCDEDGRDSIPQQQMGATYKIAESRASERHGHEAILDRLLNEAKTRYPSEAVDIRNASIGGLRHINPREERYIENVRRSDGRWSSVERTKTVYDHYVYYTAVVITTEPMPGPVTHSENFTKTGSTRADMYRLAINWLEDNKTKRRIIVESQDIDRGRIKGRVTCAARADNTYIVTSEFTIDVYDARTEIRFSEAVVQRTDPALQRAGSTEPIFLQSIADAALAEIVDFSTTLRSYILSR